MRDTEFGEDRTTLEGGLNECVSEAIEKPHKESNEVYDSFFDTNDKAFLLSNTRHSTLLIRVLWSELLGGKLADLTSHRALPNPFGFDNVTSLHHMIRAGRGWRRVDKLRPDQEYPRAYFVYELGFALVIHPELFVTTAKQVPTEVLNQQKADQSLSTLHLREEWKLFIGTSVQMDNRSSTPLILGMFKVANLTNRLRMEAFSADHPAPSVYPIVIEPRSRRSIPLSWWFLASDYTLLVAPDVDRLGRLLRRPVLKRDLQLIESDDMISSTRSNPRTPNEPFMAKSNGVGGGGSSNKNIYDFEGRYFKSYVELPRYWSVISSIQSTMKEIRSNTSVESSNNLPTSHKPILVPFGRLMEAYVSINVSKIATNMPSITSYLREIVFDSGFEFRNDFPYLIKLKLSPVRPDQVRVRSDPHLDQMYSQIRQRCYFPSKNPNRELEDLFSGQEISASLPPGSSWDLPIVSSLYNLSLTVYGSPVVRLRDSVAQRTLSQRQLDNLMDIRSTDVMSRSITSGMPARDALRYPTSTQACIEQQRNAYDQLQMNLNGYGTIDCVNSSVTPGGGVNDFNEPIYSVDRISLASLMKNYRGPQRSTRKKIGRLMKKSHVEHVVGVLKLENSYEEVLYNGYQWAVEEAGPFEAVLREIAKRNDEENRKKPIHSRSSSDSGDVEMNPDRYRRDEGGVDSGDEESLVSSSSSRSYNWARSSSSARDLPTMLFDSMPVRLNLENNEDRPLFSLAMPLYFDNHLEYPMLIMPSHRCVFERSSFSFGRTVKSYLCLPHTRTFLPWMMVQHGGGVGFRIRMLRIKLERQLDFIPHYSTVKDHMQQHDDPHNSYLEESLKPLSNTTTGGEESLSEQPLPTTSGEVIPIVEASAVTLKLSGNFFTSRKNFFVGSNPKCRAFAVQFPKENHLEESNDGHPSARTALLALVHQQETVEDARCSSSEDAMAEETTKPRVHSMRKRRLMQGAGGEESSESASSDNFSHISDLFSDESIDFDSSSESAVDSPRPTRAFNLPKHSKALLGDPSRLRHRHPHLLPNDKTETTQEMSPRIKHFDTEDPIRCRCPVQLLHSYHIRRLVAPKSLSCSLDHPPAGLTAFIDQSSNECGEFPHSLTDRFSISPTATYNVSLGARSAPGKWSGSTIISATPTLTLMNHLPFAVVVSNYKLTSGRGRQAPSVEPPREPKTDSAATLVNRSEMRSHEILLPGDVRAFYHYLPSDGLYVSSLRPLTSSLPISMPKAIKGKFKGDNTVQVSLVPCSDDTQQQTTAKNVTLNHKTLSPAGTSMVINVNFLNAEDIEKGSGLYQQSTYCMFSVARNPSYQVFNNSRHSIIMKCPYLSRTVKLLEVPDKKRDRRDKKNAPDASKRDGSYGRFSRSDFQVVPPRSAILYVPPPNWESANRKQQKGKKDDSTQPKPFLWVMSLASGSDFITDERKIDALIHVPHAAQPWTAIRFDNAISLSKEEPFRAPFARISACDVEASSYLLKIDTNSSVKSRRGVPNFRSKGKGTVSSAAVDEAESRAKRNSNANGDVFAACTVSRNGSHIISVCDFDVNLLETRPDSSNMSLSAMNRLPRVENDTRRKCFILIKRRFEALQLAVVAHQDAVKNVDSALDLSAAVEAPLDFNCSYAMSVRCGIFPFGTQMATASLVEENPYINECTRAALFVKDVYDALAQAMSSFTKKIRRRHIDKAHQRGAHTYCSVADSIIGDDLRLIKVVPSVPFVRISICVDIKRTTIDWYTQQKLTASASVGQTQFQIVYKPGIEPLIYRSLNGGVSEDGHHDPAYLIKPTTRHTSHVLAAIRHSEESRLSGSYALNELFSATADHEDELSDEAESATGGHRGDAPCFAATEITSHILHLHHRDHLTRRSDRGNDRQLVSLLKAARGGDKKRRFNKKKRKGGGEQSASSRWSLEDDPRFDDSDEVDVISIQSLPVVDFGKKKMRRLSKPERLEHLENALEDIHIFSHYDLKEFGTVTILAMAELMSSLGFNYESRTSLSVQDIKIRHTFSTENGTLLMSYAPREQETSWKKRAPWIDASVTIRNMGTVLAPIYSTADLQSSPILVDVDFDVLGQLFSAFKTEKALFSNRNLTYHPSVSHVLRLREIHTLEALICDKGTSENHSATDRVESIYASWLSKTTPLSVTPAEIKKQNQLLLSSPYDSNLPSFLVKHGHPYTLPPLFYELIWQADNRSFDVPISTGAVESTTTANLFTTAQQQPTEAAMSSTSLISRFSSEFSLSGGGGKARTNSSSYEDVTHDGGHPSVSATEEEGRLAVMFMESIGEWNIPYVEGGGGKKKAAKSMGLGQVLDMYFKSLPGVTNYHHYANMPPVRTPLPALSHLSALEVLNLQQLNISEINITFQVQTAQKRADNNAMRIFAALPLDMAQTNLTLPNVHLTNEVKTREELTGVLKYIYRKNLTSRAAPSAVAQNIFSFAFHGYECIRQTIFLTSAMASSSQPVTGILYALRYGVASFSVRVIGGIWTSLAHILNFANKVFLNARPRPTSVLDGVIAGIRTLIILVAVAPLLNFHQHFTHGFMSLRKNMGSFLFILTVPLISIFLPCLLLLELIFRVPLGFISGFINLLASISEGFSKCLLSKDHANFLHYE
eukprot:GHVH01009529.1.p1 GENE.GHVH01009529.1~~GHVH01009529.1.p1  ORF type:complete len:2605 (+),score=384.65 GHVH01009529.1:2137-9951(+)